jgi:hypothetical protein
MHEFLDFSADVTAFAKFDLYGTGQAELYFETVKSIVGEATLNELLAAYKVAHSWKGAAREEILQSKVFSDEKLGPVAQAIVKLWYVGIWYQLPDAWIQKYGPVSNNTTFMVAPAAYTEGLLWTAIGANPNGAKAPGYASWAEAPQYPAIPILP